MWGCQNPFCCNSISDQDVDAAAAQCTQNRRHFDQPGRNSDHSLDLKKGVYLDANHALVLFRLDELPIPIIEAQADVANSPLSLDLAAVLQGESIPTSRKKGRRLHGADSDHGKIDLLKQVQSLPDDRIPAQDFSRVFRSDDARRLQQDGLRSNQSRKLENQLRRVLVSVRSTDTSHHLDNLAAPSAICRAHRLHHGKK